MFKKLLAVALLLAVSVLPATAATTVLNSYGGTYSINGSNGFTAVGTTAPTTMLTVNGTTTSTLFAGSGASLTSIPLSGLAAIGSNTLAANATASSASPTAVSLPSCTDTSGNHLNYTLASGFSCGTSDSHVGTVTSVAVTGDGIIFNGSFSGSPITSSGTFNFNSNLISQIKNTILAGPTTGSNASPTFRLLVGDDMPLPGASSLGGVFSLAAVSHQFLTSIGTSGLATQAQPAFSDVSGTASVTQGGTGTTTQFTQGSVVFAGASGVYSQDNSNFFWDATNHRLGIGTATPAIAIDQQTIGSSTTIAQARFGNRGGSSDTIFIDIGSGRQMVGENTNFGLISAGSGRGQQFTTNGTSGTLGSGTINATMFSGGGMGIGTTTALTGSVLVLGGGHLGFQQSAVPAASSCGSGTTAASSTDNKGSVTGVTAATACTITFSTALPAAPSCQLMGNPAVVTPSITAISTTAVTFGMTAFTGTFYYLCF